VTLVHIGAGTACRARPSWLWSEPWGRLAAVGSLPPRSNFAHRCAGPRCCAAELAWRARCGDDLPARRSCARHENRRRASLVATSVHCREQRPLRHWLQPSAIRRSILDLVQVASVAKMSCIVNEKPSATNVDKRNLSLRAPRINKRRQTAATRPAVTHALRSGVNRMPMHKLATGG